MHNPWVQILLLLAPAIVVPLALHDLRKFRPFPSTIKWNAPAAASLLIAHILPAGPAAGFLAVPWLIFSTYLLRLVWISWPTQGGPGSPDRILRLGAFAYLSVGAAWALADRFAWQPLGFDPLIVLLTAVHFHYAGFALLWIGAKALPYCRARWERYLLSSIILGVPLTAIGITASHFNWSPGIEMASVLIMAAGGISLGLLYLRMAITGKGQAGVRTLWLLAGLALLLGMSLAILYGMRYLWPLPWLSIPWMYAVHGTLNSIGFALSAMLGWHWHQPDQSTRFP
jgi:hypothetical protein